MKNVLRLLALFAMVTTLLQQQSETIKAQDIGDAEHVELMARAKERAERTLNRIHGRSPSQGSNYENLSK